VVLKPDRTPGEAELKEFVSARLAYFKVPRRIVFVDEIPKGPTGKLQRISLAVKLGLDKPETVASVLNRPATLPERLREPMAPPPDPIAAHVARIWEEEIGTSPIGLADNFFEIGGHSLLAVTVFHRIEKELGVNLPLSCLFEAPTVQDLAARIRTRRGDSFAALVPIRAHGTSPPLYCIPGHGGGVLFYRRLAGALSNEQPVYGLQSIGLDGGQSPKRTVEEMAAAYIEEIRAVQPDGPYCLVGYCLGAYVALEIAHRLQEEGDPVGLLAVVATDGAWRLVNGSSGGTWFHLSHLARLSLDEKVRYFEQRLRYRGDLAWNWAVEKLARRFLDSGVPLTRPLRYRYIRALNMRANREYQPKHFKGDILYFEGRARIHRDPGRFWSTVASGQVDVRPAEGRDIDIFEGPGVSEIAAEIGRRLKDLDRGARERA
jgi:thioesterase domain-containing protein/acyl carrier protein